MTIKSVYIIGSLRNEQVVKVGNKLREAGIEGFDDWSSPGPEADDYWRKYSEARGQTYKEALNSWAAKHVFEFDKHHLDRCDAAILVCPAGKSCHLELGYMVGRGKPTWVLMDDPERWDVMYQFATGISYDVDEIVKEVTSHNIKASSVKCWTTVDAFIPPFGPTLYPV
jgi:nucleoside 2-deoxyribosyltransferase